MKKKLLIVICMPLLVLSSCKMLGSAIRDNLQAETDHAVNITAINLQFVNCLREAQTHQDTILCQNEKKEKIDSENKRYEEVKQKLKEIEKCEELQKYILEEWGYSDNEAKKATEELRGYSITSTKVVDSRGEYVNRYYLAKIPKKNLDYYSYDCAEAVSELLYMDYCDKVAVQKFAKALEKHGLSKDSAESITMQYYKDEMYIDATKKNVRDCFDRLVLGFELDDARIDEIFVEFGYIEDENDGGNNGSDDVDVTGGGNNGNGSDLADSTGRGNVQVPTPPKQTQPDTNRVDGYYAESKVISNTIIAKYGFNETQPTQDQLHDLDKVVVFMKKWPNAKVTIVGHTCSIGSEAGNNTVGRLRAYHAQMYLLSKGIKSRSVSIESRADKEPYTSNDTEENRKLNRRITFIVN